MDHNKHVETKIAGFTLLETIIAMTLISLIFVMIVQSFNTLLLGSYLIDARTAVRNESEFVGEYFKLRIKNADPRSIKCSAPNDPIKSVTWQPKGASDTFIFYGQKEADDKYRFCMAQATTPVCETVLTYADVKVTSLAFTCETPDFDEAQVANVNLTYTMESTAKLGEEPAVKNISRFINVSIR
ncbi:MAG: PulJ/GspJ family protein [Patescibacteria group bacterium]